MKRKIYKIFEIDTYTGEEYHIFSGFSRVSVESLVLDLHNKNIPCTDYCYYDYDNIRYDILDIKQSWNIK